MARVRKEVMSLRMEATFHERLKRVAERKGLPISGLIRMWLLERLEQETDEEKRRKAAR